MPNPKRRMSASRRDKRRAQFNAKHSVAPALAVDSATGEAHRPHHAHWVGDKLYYKGQVVMDKSKVNKETK
ncbi:MAG: 50S ribosomal protein L32 [Chloroherpetonaceae bacterium]|nr:50S ribosomal protein L32 [Chloroherpetonaceae bacterium]